MDKNELKKLGILSFENQLKSGKRGQPKNIYYLNEEQYLFLIMNMRTKSNEKDLVLNLKMIISKMENSAFFILKEKFKNVREVLSITQLSKIIVADMIVKTAIIEGMEKEMYYKDIFQLAKKKIDVLWSNSSKRNRQLDMLKFET